jgi:hypothetical protein
MDQCLNDGGLPAPPSPAALFQIRHAIFTEYQTRLYHTSPLDKWKLLFETIHPWRWISGTLDFCCAAVQMRYDVGLLFHV